MSIPWITTTPLHTGAIPADNYTCTIASLLPSTVYEYHAYMIVGGVSYSGETCQLTTLPIPTHAPVVTTGVAYNITDNSIGVCNNCVTDKGNLNANEYGVLYTQSGAYATDLQMIYGNPNICKQSINADIAINTGYFTGSGNLLTSLSPNVETFYRAFVKNTVGSGYGAIKSQITNPALPPTYNLTRIGSTSTVPRDNATIATIKLATTGVANGTTVAFTIGNSIDINDINSMKVNGSVIAKTLTGNFVIGNQGLYNGSYLELTFSSAVSTITKTMAIYLTSNTNKLVNIVIGNVNNGNGKLYNWYAATDVRNIANTGWRVPDESDWTTLYAYGGGISASGSGLKETGIIHWNVPNADYSTNVTNFNGRGSGGRSYGSYLGGSFYGIMFAHYMWQYDATTPIVNDLRYNSMESYRYQTFKAEGLSIRLVRVSGTVGNGNVGSYTGNDGTNYATIGIGTQEWMSINLKETRYFNNDLIPQVTDNEEWHTLTTGAFSWYNNDSSYE